MNVKESGSLLVEKDDQVNLKYPKMKLTEPLLHHLRHVHKKLKLLFTYVPVAMYVHNPGQ